MVTIYVLLSLKNGIHYVGMTTDLERRLKEHNAGKSKFTSGHTPWIIIYQEDSSDFSEGRKREKYLKSAAGKKFILKLLQNQNEATQPPFHSGNTGSLPD